MSGSDRDIVMTALLRMYFCSVLFGSRALACARAALLVVVWSAGAFLATSGLGALAQSAGGQDAAAGGTPQGGFVSGEILVRFKDGLSDAEIDAMIQSYGGQVLDYIEKLHVYHLRIPEGRTVDQMIELYANDPRCEYVERNYIGGGGGLIPDDTFYREQWHLDNDGQTGGTADADIDAVEGWRITQGDPTVVAAILDTGIDRRHREFRRRLLPGHDFVDEDGDPEADHPHGPLVAGVLAANSDNGFGVAGVDRRVTILPVKVLDRNNRGTVVDLAEGLVYAADQGADVINMSLINYPLGGILNNALRYARNAGSILVACAGNGGIGDADVSGPGASRLTISVGATDHDDLRADFSGTGRRLDVVAPGLEVVTTAFDADDDGATFFSGCSAATPVVSGIATLLLSIDPSLRHNQVRAILRRTADDQVGDPDEDEPGRDDFFGFGRVNLNNALSELVTAVAVDVNPRRCPNSFAVMNEEANPLVRAAILGSAAFDVSEVNIATVRLGGAAPEISSTSGVIRDVAGRFFPMIGKQRARDCGRRGPDGRNDLLLQCDRQEIVDRLGPVSHRDVVVLPLTARLLDGTAIRGEDVVRIRVPPSQRQNLAQSSGGP
jgi:thermitase